MHAQLSTRPGPLGVVLDETKPQAEERRMLTGAAH